MTIGGLYRGMLWLYPSDFRKQFSEEMISVFEQRAGERFADRDSGSFGFLLIEFSSVLKGACIMWLGKIRPINRKRSASGSALITAPALSFEDATKQRGLAIGNMVAAIADQISDWRSMRPWLILLGLAVPTTLFLSSSTNSLWGMLYVQLNARLHYGVPYRVGVSTTALLFIVVCQAAALATWSCINGFAIGYLSRRAYVVMEFLLCTLWVCRIGWDVITMRNVWIFLLATKTLLLFGPFLLGVIFGTRTKTLHFRLTVVLIVSAVAITSLRIWTHGWLGHALVAWSLGAIHENNSLQAAFVRLTPFLYLIWPVVFTVAMARKNLPRGWSASRQ
jgi:hypothetical protein